MSSIWCVPSILRDWTDDCLATLRIPEESLLVIDNTTVNKGVAGSWNLGIDATFTSHSDWLVICSAGTRFGRPGGCDFLDALRSPAAVGAHAVEAGRGLGWHLIAFPRATLELVGYFDENLYPGYYEDIDYARRMQLAYGGLDVLYWPKVDVDAMVPVVAHGLDPGHTHVDFVGGEAYMARKWNGHKDVWPRQGFTHPFGDPSKDWRWWPTPPDPRCFIPDDRPYDLPWRTP